MSSIVNISRSAVLGLILSGAAMPFAALASATPTSVPTCNVVADGAVNHAGTASSDRFALASGNVTSKFTVFGASDCRINVTLTAWTAPNGTSGTPYNLQRVYSHTTGNFGPGEHSLATKAPDCFYQFDLVRGTTAGAADGSPLYESGRLIAWAKGGTKVCVAPTPSPSPTPIPTHTPSPSPLPTPKPTPVVTPSPTPTPAVLGASTATLPATGGAIGGVIGLTSMAGATFAYLRSRRGL